MFCKHMSRVARVVGRDSSMIMKRNLVVANGLKAQLSMPSSTGSGKFIAGTFALSAACYSSSPANCAVAAASSSDSGPEFTLTKSGLRYRDLVIGTGPSPKQGDEVSVHYTGWLDGFDSKLKFDSSYDRNAPLDFHAGVQQVIEGWDEALLTDMKVGTKREVIIPPNLGYGRHGAGRVIPPQATLYFRMELVAVNKQKK